MKLTCAGVRKRGSRGGNRGVGVNHVALFSEFKGLLSSKGIGSQWSLAAWGNGSKINCVCLTLSPKLSGLTPEDHACKGAAWSMWGDTLAVLCVPFASQLFDKPVNHWESIPHSNLAALNLPLIKLEMYFWLPISLIVLGEGLYGCFRENLQGCDCVDRCKIFSLLESAPFHSEWFPSRPLTAGVSIQESRKQSRFLSFIFFSYGWREAKSAMGESRSLRQESEQNQWRLRNPTGVKSFPFSKLKLIHDKKGLLRILYKQWRYTSGWTWSVRVLMPHLSNEYHVTA